jgi:pimeloyl-ACP methyl ester carboxylesterase
VKTTYTSIPGTLVTLSLPGRKHPNLDGFWTRGRRKNRTLLIFVHGMGSNFYKSKFKKTWLRLGPKSGVDVFSFNNRGCEGGVADETFKDCIHDIDAALHFARAEGYKRIFLLGHSTGCQKITYYQNRRKPRDVKGIVLAAPGDDLAIAKRDLGNRYAWWLKRARQLVADGKGTTRLPSDCLNFTAHRFLSAVDPTKTEANLFRLDGPMKIFRQLKLPVLAVFPENEQYACIPVKDAASRLHAITKSKSFSSIIIPHADHSFHGHEESGVKACLKWLNHVRSK